MDDCIFCKIIAGEIPSTKVYEDEGFLGFMDINPVTRGHCLMIPKEHHETLHVIPDELLGAYFVAVKKLGAAVVEGLGAKGLNIVQSNGRAANQIVDHMHVHLIPRYEPNEIPLAAWELKPGDPKVIADAADLIKKGL